MGKVVIPFAKNKDTFQLRESSRELPIVKWLVLTIQVILRSVIPEALTRSNMSLFFANGIILVLLLFSSCMRQKTNDTQVAESMSECLQEEERTEPIKRHNKW